MDVFGNANFSCIGKTKTFPHMQYFFLRFANKTRSSGSWWNCETGKFNSFNNSTKKRVLKLLDLTDLTVKSNSFNSKNGPFFSTPSQPFLTPYQSILIQKSIVLEPKLTI